MEARTASGLPSLSGRWPVKAILNIFISYHAPPFASKPRRSGEDAVLFRLCSFRKAPARGAGLLDEVGVEPRRGGLEMLWSAGEVCNGGQARKLLKPAVVLGRKRPCT